MVRKRAIDAYAFQEELKETYDAVKLIRDSLHFDDEKKLCEAQMIIIAECVMRLKEQPTIEPATRCENCHNCIEINETLYCNFWNRNTEYDWYCCQGW